MVDDKPEPIPLPIEVVVNNVRVTVTSLLKHGTTVERANDAPGIARCAAR